VPRRFFGVIGGVDPRLKKQQGDKMKPSFIIINFIMVMKMDALDVVWQLINSFKTICDERE